MEAVSFVLRYRANNAGKSPRWDSYSKIRDIIERMVLNTTESLLPIISFSPKASEEDKKKHQEFIVAMKELGYEEKAARIVCEWFLRVRKSS
jgi:serine protein kinase